MRSIECYDGDCDLCVDSPDECSCSCHEEIRKELEEIGDDEDE